MNVWSWSAFFMRGVGESLHGAKVYVHFFPVANGVTAPYPVEAFLEVFAKGKLLARQGFEGLRVNQPDGLDLADVFPQLFANRPSADEGLGGPSPHTQARELGITVQFGTTQPRVDLSKSRVMIEVCYPSHRIRYHAVQAGRENMDAVPETGLFGHDTFETRIIEINPEPAEQKMEVVTPQVGADAPETNLLESNGELGGYSLRALSLEDRHLPLASGMVNEEGFLPAGRLAKALKDEDEMEELESPQDAVVRYLVQYETTSALPVSVRCL